MGSVTFGLRLFLALVFLGAALPKLSSPREFRRALENYGLVPESLVGPVAASVPSLEFCCSFCLLVGVATTAVAAVAATMLLLFAAAVAINLVRGHEIDCGCYGSHLPRRITWRLVVRDLAFAVAAVGVARGPVSATALRLPWEPGAAPDASELAAVAVASTTIWLAERLASEGWRAYKARSVSVLGGVV